VKCVAISKQWVTVVEDCEYTVTLLRMTLRIGHRGFQPALVKIVTLLYFYFYVSGSTANIGAITWQAYRHTGIPHSERLYIYIYIYILFYGMTSNTAWCSLLEVQHTATWPFTPDSSRQQMTQCYLSLPMTSSDTDIIHWLSLSTGDHRKPRRHFSADRQTTEFVDG